MERKLVERGVLAESDPAGIEDWAKRQVEEALAAVEGAPAVALETLIEDVTKETPRALEEQFAELERALGKTGHRPGAGGKH